VFLTFVGKMTILSVQFFLKSEANICVKKLKFYFPPTKIVLTLAGGLTNWLSTSVSLGHFYQN